MVRVGVYTRNKGKLIGVEKAFREFFNGGVEVYQVYMDGGGLPSQPRSILETFLGAMRRAELCRKYFVGDYYIGVEGGIHLIDGDADKCMAFHIAYVIKKDGRTGIGMSSGYRVPAVYVEDILRDEMAKVLNRITDKEDAREYEGLIGILSGGMVTRIDLTYEAVRNALIEIVYSAE